MQPQYKQIEPNRGSFNLNNNRIVRFFLTNTYVQPTLQILSVALFFLTIYTTFFGPQNVKTNFGSIVLWGIWWTPIMLISLLLFGRVWCYICPMGAIAKFLQRFSLNRRFPMFNKKWALGLSVSTLTALSFILARLQLYKFGVTSSPSKTGIYFLIILAISVIVTLLFERRVFCRYICPATGVMSVTAKLSPVEFVHEKDEGVRTCVTAEFKSNYLSTDHRCVFCMNCTVEQPKATVKMRFRWPGDAAVKEKFPLIDEALIALIIFAVFPIDHVIGKVIANLTIIKGLPYFLAKSVPYLSSIIATIVVFALVNKIAAWWSGLDAKESFTRFASAYVPLGIMFQLFVNMIPSLMNNGLGYLNGVATGLGISLNLPKAWVSPATVTDWTHLGHTWFLWLGVLWGTIIAWYIAKDMVNEKKNIWKAILPHFLFMAVSIYVVMTTVIGMKM